MSMQLNLTETTLATLPWLVSIAESGSQTLPWIKNPHDRDIVFYTKGTITPEMKDQFKKVRQQWRPGGECWMLENIEDIIYLFSYQYKFLKPIWGSELPNWDIFDPQVSREIKRYLVHWATINNSIEYKLWYHVLTLIYLYQNNDYFLTEAQQSEVQACHDKQMSLETYNYILNNVNIWAEELNLPKIRLDRVIL
jgi:hypothetical protein